MAVGVSNHVKSGAFQTRSKSVDEHGGHGDLRSCQCFGGWRFARIPGTFAELTLPRVEFFFILSKSGRPCMGPESCADGGVEPLEADGADSFCTMNMCRNHSLTVRNLPYSYQATGREATVANTFTSNFAVVCGLPWRSTTLNAGPLVTPPQATCRRKRQHRARPQSATLTYGSSNPDNTFWSISQLCVRHLIETLDSDVSFTHAEFQALAPDAMTARVSQLQRRTHSLGVKMS